MFPLFIFRFRSRYDVRRFIRRLALCGSDSMVRLVVFISRRFSPDTRGIGMRNVLLIAGVLLSLSALDTHARQRPLSPEEKSALQKIQIVSIDTLALTERGAVESSDIRRVVTDRIRDLGYTVSTDKQQPSDIVVKVKCEERKTWLGPTRLGGDADSLHAPSRVWKGPACQITYYFPESPDSPSPWRREVRTPFADAMRAAQEHHVSDSGAYAMQALAQELRQDPFPLLLAAEWRHVHRLIAALNRPNIPPARQRLVLQLLGDIPDPQALATLEKALKVPELAPTAAIALGQHGAAAIRPLVTLLEHTDSSALKKAAVAGLGIIGTHHEDPMLFEVLKNTLQHSPTPIDVTIEVVNALGKLGDERAISLLQELNRRAWTDPSRSPEMQRLREALSWSLWQLIPEAHTAE
ncbi:MAG: HEAT repeat domain-containing protein [Nitrospirae bacterium]|nr:MAG: HEAT repeat domain-containing protein [Nitrospirota bacterium]